MPFLQPVQPSEEQQRPDYSQFYNPQQFSVPGDVIKYRLESDDILTKLEHDLAGETFVEGTGWVKKYGREINDEGLSAVHTIVSHYCNRGCYLGNLNFQQINFKCMAIKKELSKLLFKKYKIYEVDKAKRGLLTRKIVDTVHLSLSRAEGAMESESLGRTFSRNEIIHEEKNPQKQGGLFKFFRMGLSKGRQSYG